MTHRPLRRVEPDGTRVYADYHLYKPMADEERINQRRRPDDPRAVRFHALWFLPLEVLEDDQRTMPETRPDTDAYDHMPRPCRCEPCRRPQAQRWVRKWQRENGLRVRPATEKNLARSS